MLDDTETGASLKKTKTGGNTAIGQVDHRVMDQISHDSEARLQWRLSGKARREP
jgi:hypothetical protein